MTWSDYPLQSIEIPNNHGTTGPYIYLGTGDPIAAALGQSAAETFHFGSHNSGFVLGLKDQSTVANDDGLLILTADSDQAAGPTEILNFRYIPASGIKDVRFGSTDASTTTSLYGGEMFITCSDVLQIAAGTSLINSGATMVDGNSHQYLRGESRSTNMSFTGVTSATQAVTFSHTFNGVPNVTTNIQSGAGPTAQWHSRAINVTTTGFTLFVFVASGTSTWTNVPVQWIATESTP